MKKYFSYFTFVMPARLVYMLQQVEYDPNKFFAWLWRVPNLSKVSRRGRLVQTRKAQALLLIGYGTMGLGLVLVLTMLRRELWLSAVVFLLLLPLWVGLVLAVVVKTGYVLLQIVRRPLLGKAEAQLRAHPAVKIAILGSYGKTTMKELLLTVLSQGKRVKATPGNMNVPISHARWITSKVNADEEVLIFEYGEGEPGDIAKFAAMTHPDYAVITGLAPNHLDHYPSLEAVADDLLSIRSKVPDDRLLLNVEAASLSRQAGAVPTYGLQGVKDWKISDVKVAYEGTSFTMKQGKTALHLRSKLLGRHQVGPLAAAAALAYDLDLSPAQIEAGIAATKPFEHRMEARPLHGAWIIDDTYNGNLEGIRAGLQLLGDLEAKRKVYVTPGLVDQGAETERVHLEIGQLIAAAKPDKVVLMQNSVTDFIKQGLEAGGFKGELALETDPLSYYTNLEHTLAAGDLVIMQNDWTDNYL